MTLMFRKPRARAVALAVVSLAVLLSAGASRKREEPVTAPEPPEVESQAAGLEPLEPSQSEPAAQYAAPADEEVDSLAAMARRNLELEERYGGELSHGRERPMTMWERLKHVIGVVAATGPTR